MPEDSRIAETLLDLARDRGQEASFCPSDAARALSPQDWKPLLPRVRQVASRLQRDGLISVTQAGQAVDALGAEGPIRLSRPMH
ncbi:MAG: hypothetical protein ACJA1L_003402 [Paracoccaceae bacterium]|jgi:hypothetical protein